MASYNLNVPVCATRADATNFTTILGLKFANTAGHRGKLRRLVVGGDDTTVGDEQVAIAVQRTDNTGDGTSTSVNVNTIGKADSLAIASNVVAIGKSYNNGGAAAEPTTMESGVVAGGVINERGTLVLDWAGDERPIWGKDQTLCIRARPKVAGILNLNVTVEWDE